MKNSKLRRVLLLLASAVLLVCLSVGATLAYLTSEDSVKNTFTVGQVKITLDEAEVYEPNFKDEATGKDIGGTAKTPENRVKQNYYKFLPDHDVDKDPTVTVLKGSEECYVRVLVTVTRFADLKTILKGDAETIDDDVAAAKPATYVLGYNDAQFDDYGWDFEGDSVVYEFRLTDTVKLNKDADQKFVLFTGIDVPADLTVEDLEVLQSAEGEEDMTITCEAHAIQADGFDDADAAWAAFKK